MGREAFVTVRAAGKERQTKVMLEAHELIVQGSPRVKLAISPAMSAQVQDDRLLLGDGSDQIEIWLGAEQAQDWLKRIRKPPPSLAAKLGLNTYKSAMLLGHDHDPALIDCLERSGVHQVETLADIAIATIRSVDEALVACSLAAGAPVWTLFLKGKSAPFCEGDLRDALRAIGRIDTKSCSVSAATTAIRWTVRAA